MSTKNISFKGTAIHYQVEGTGQPVVLLHGFAEDGRIFEEQVQYLKTEAMLIVPDLPGSGRSPYNPQYSSLDDYAEAVKEILQAEELEQSIVIGHSMGGYISLSLVERYPQMVSGFGLFHSSALPDDEDKVAMRRKGIRFIQEHGSSAFLAQSIPNLFSDSTKEHRPELIQQVLERYSNFDERSLVQYYEAMIQRPDRRKVLQESGKPVLLILGQNDTAVPLEKGLQQATIPKICYIHICYNSGHMGMLEETALCNKALAHFIKK